MLMLVEVTHKILLLFVQSLYFPDFHLCLKYDGSEWTVQ